MTNGKGSPMNSKLRELLEQIVHNWKDSSYYCEAITELESLIADPTWPWAALAADEQPAPVSVVLSEQDQPADRFADVVDYLQRYGRPSEQMLALLEAVEVLNDDSCNMRLLDGALGKVQDALAPFLPADTSLPLVNPKTRYVRVPSRQDPKYHEVWPEIEGGPVFEGHVYCAHLFEALRRERIVLVETLPVGTFAIACRKFPHTDPAPACPSDCPCGRSRSFGGCQTHEVKPAGHNPIRATPYDSDAKPYDALLPFPVNTVLSVELPAFDGYQAHIVRELQAAFVQACEKVNIKVRGVAN